MYVQHLITMFSEHFASSSPGSRPSEAPSEAQGPAQTCDFTESTKTCDLGPLLAWHLPSCESALAPDAPAAFPRPGI